MARKPLLIAALAASFALPAAASASTTVGPDVTGAHNSEYLCNGGCTMYQTSPAATIPDDGVLVRWRIDVGNQTGPLRLRILRRSGGNVSAINASATETPSSLGVSTFSTQISVRAGDVLGIDLPTGTGIWAVGTPGAALLSRAGVLPDGATVAESSEQGFPDDRLMLNGDVEPDADHDGLGDETQDDDDDADGLADGSDDCPNSANPGQADMDGDGAGDVCDADVDGDGIQDASDNCTRVSNAAQADLDGDGEGDACDADVDGDGLPDSTEAAIATNPRVADSDGDGRSDGSDACPTLAAATANGCPPPAAPLAPPTPAASLPKATVGLVGVPKRITRKKLRRGLRVKVVADQPVALDIELRARRSVLAEKLLEAAGSAKLRARTHARKVVVRVIATNASGKHTVVRRTIRVKK